MEEDGLTQAVKGEEIGNEEKRDCQVHPKRQIQLLYRQEGAQDLPIVPMQVSASSNESAHASSPEQEEIEIDIQRPFPYTPVFRSFRPSRNVRERIVQVWIRDGERYGHPDPYLPPHQLASPL